MYNNTICNRYDIFQVRRLQQQQLIYLLHFGAFCSELALHSCHTRSALGLRSYHILVFSYHIILVHIALFSIPVMWETGSPVVRLKAVARLCRIRSFFAALSSLISSDNNEIRIFIRPCSYLIIPSIRDSGNGALGFDLA